MRTKKIDYKVKKMLSESLEDLPIGEPRFIPISDFRTKVVSASADYLQREKHYTFSVIRTDNGTIVTKY